MSTNFGDQMKGAVNEALKTGNYERLNTLVADAVNGALNDAGATASKAWQQREAVKQQRDAVREQSVRQQEILERQRIAREKAAMEARERRQAEMRQRNELMQQRNQGGLPVKIKKNGFVAGVLFVVFGAIANVPLLVLSIIGMALGWGATGALLFSLFVSILFICSGKRKIQLVNKAKRYVKLCGTKMYAEVDELASRVGMSARRVEKDLRKILQKGIIPSGRMDKKGTHLMLNDTVYRQYADAEKARLLREKEEKEQAKLEAKKPKELPLKEDAQPKTELEQMIAEGQEFIEKLHYMNDLIPGEVISTKLYKLEELLKEIFRRLEKEPAQRNRMHKVMNYYLPTTMKLVEAYHEFDVVSSPGEDILAAKAEIEATLDTINAAFVELLNSLFQDKVFDVTTDAQVLQTVLASEGLTKEMDFAKVDKEV